MFVYLQCHPKVIGDSDQLMSVTLECIYSCERDDQLALCYDVLECLPQRGYGWAHITGSNFWFNFSLKIVMVILCTTILKFGVTKIFFSFPRNCKDALNWSKYKCFKGFQLQVNAWTSVKTLQHFPHNNINKKWAPNQHISIIFEGSCDTSMLK